jgi:DNA-directed RNA polymerase specialized sigma24 family protein
MAEKTGKSRGEVARIFYPFVKVRLYPDYRELRPDTDAKIRDQVVRKHRRSEYELNRIRAQLKTLASGEEWPADPHPRAVPKGTGDGPKKRKPLTHAHLAALDNPVKGRRAICRWTGPRTRDDDTPVYALPDGTAAPYVGAESIERYRQRTTGVMKAKKLPVYETDEYEDALADYEAAVERVEQSAPELDELQDRDAPANADAADAEALSLLEGEPEESETPEASAEALALADTLSAKEFEAMTFAYVHHMTNDVIAQKMGVKPETVKTWLSRGRDKVRDTTGREPERRPSGATTKKAA